MNEEQLKGLIASFEATAQRAKLSSVDVSNAWLEAAQRARHFLKTPTAVRATAFKPPVGEPPTAADLEPPKKRRRGRPRKTETEAVSED